METENDMNEKLYKLQEAWYNDLNKTYKGENFSSPFCFGLPDKKTIEGQDKKPLLMYVGEEARNWRFKQKDDIGYIQNYAIAYSEYQLSGESSRINDVYTREDRDAVQKKNSSPFWTFLREIQEETGCEVCWNNLDKLHRVTSKNGKKETKPLTVGQEKELHKPFNDSNKSLLWQEINSVKPDYIVFMGAGYKQSIECALDISLNKKPNADTIKKITDCNFGYTPKGVFWICHPAWLQWNGKEKKEKILRNLISEINN